jgi:hypothetical protein
MEEPVSEDPKVSTRKFESFESKDSGDNGILTESIPMLETIVSNVLRNVESFDGFDLKL